MTDQKFPAGWDEARVRQLVAELDARTEEEWLAADEAAVTAEPGEVVIKIPASLLPEVQRLLARHKDPA